MKCSIMVQSIGGRSMGWEEPTKTYNFLVIFVFTSGQRTHGYS